MFDKVLIANRGAIAVRIERTLKKMGIGSVAVYSKADQDSLHVERADEAVYIGDGTAKETYLDTKKIIKAALDTGAKAIHPGYGFLSENTDFAKECEENGIKFIGPDSEVIRFETFRKSTCREGRCSTVTWNRTFVRSGRSSYRGRKNRISGYLKEHRRRRWNRNEDL